MLEPTDAQLLRDYAEHRNEAAFRELVNRHADVVYASALRQVSSPDLAHDIAQSVFTDLARKAQPLAGTLTGDASLLGWLFRSTRFLALNQLRNDRRRQARERQAMENFDPASETASEWERVQPVLDEAMADLSDEDRDALLLRFFKSHDFRAIGAALGVSDDAAQKRVSRALERLRTQLTSRSVTTTAVALSTVLTTNAVPLAPAGLAATLSTAALAGTTLATTATATALKTIAMTTLQKTVITATLAAAVGTGIYEGRKVSSLQAQVQTLQQNQTPLAEQVQQLQSERNDAISKLASLREDNDRLNRNTTELLRLRGEVSRLRRDWQEMASATATNATPDSSTTVSSSDPNWKPNWTPVRPFDLGQFPDSATNVVHDLAADVGTETPAALLQTWIWAQRMGDTASLLRTMDFADQEMLERFKGNQKSPSQRSETGGPFERYKLRDMFSLGGNRYLVLIEESSNNPNITAVGQQIFRRIGDEWKVYVPGKRK
jgi:RNA polymerase sigma factor (sigma-70 family)